MALKRIRIGSLDDFHQYDDALFPTAIETDEAITVAAIVVADGGYVGSTSVPTAIQIEADGDVLIAQKLGLGVTPTATLSINGGAHVGGSSHPGDNNLLVDGTGTIVGAFGCNGAAAQTAYASGGALTAYATGAFGLDSNAHMQAMFDLVVAMRAALVANGIMS